MPNDRRPSPSQPVTIDALVRAAVDHGLHIHVHLHDDVSDAVNIGPILTRIFAELRALRAQGVVEMATVQEVQAKIAELQTSVESETSLDESVKTLLEGQNALLLDLKAQLAEAIKNNDPAALQGVLESLTAVTQTNTANAEKLAAAVIANTPVADAPPDQPPTSQRSRR